MIQFFEDRHGRLYPTSLIDRISEKPKTDKSSLYTHRVYLRDRDDMDALDVDASTVRMIQQNAGALLPAMSGTFLLEFSTFGADEPDESCVWRSVVLGWRVGGQFSGVEPVVLDGDFEHMTSDHAIAHPDGRIETAFEGRFENEQGWISERLRCARVKFEQKGNAA